MQAAAEDAGLRALRRDFRVVGATLQRLTMAAVEQEATAYPIFVAHAQREVAPALGLPAATDPQLQFAFRIAPIEELVRKGLIEADEKGKFIDAAGDAYERACILLVEGEAARFVFIPYEREL